MHVRRAVLALVIAASGFVVGAAAAGFQGETAQAFAVPGLHIGDQGQYNRTDAGADGQILRFLVADESSWFEADGRPVATVRLAVERDEGYGGRWLHHVAADGWRPVADRVPVTGEGAAVGVGVGPVDFWRGAFSFADVTAWPAAGPWCGLLHDQQGATVRDGTLLVPIGDCPGGAFEPAGDGNVAGYPVRVFEHPGGLRLHIGGEFPVPLRIEDAEGAWDLVLFGRGAGPPAGHAATGDAAAIEHAPYRHGPDPSGVDHPFPLDQAVDLALMMPGNPLSAFFGAHRDAYIAGASYVAEYEPGTRTRAWTVIATDGQEQVAARLVEDGVQVHRTTSGLPAGTGLVLPGVPVPRVEERPAPAGPFPHPSALPETLPTVASLIARWEDHAQPGDRFAGANGWGFRFRCGEDCGTAQVDAWAGLNRTEALTHKAVDDAVPEVLCFPLPCMDHQKAWTGSYLAVDAAGTSTWMLETDWTVIFGAGYTDDVRRPILDASGSNVKGTPGIEPLTLEAAVWSWPSTPVAASLSLISLVLGALYYFWPAAKAAGVGLFTRVNRDDALEHPLRAGIVEHVRQEPGIHLQALARATGRETGVLRHHLGILQARGLVVSRVQGGYRCYFPERTARATIEAAPALRTAAARAIWAAARQHPGLAMQDAANAAGLTPSAATYHVRRLARAGLVERRRDGRSVRLYPAVAA